MTAERLSTCSSIILMRVALSHLLSGNRATKISPVSLHISLLPTVLPLHGPCCIFAFQILTRQFQLYSELRTTGVMLPAESCTNMSTSHLLSRYLILCCGSVTLLTYSWCRTRHKFASYYAYQRSLRIGPHQTTKII